MASFEDELSVTARRTESVDACQIIKLANEETDLLFGRVDVVNMIEKANLAVTLADADNRIYAHASFYDYPIVSGNSLFDWESLLGIGNNGVIYSSANTLFLRYFVFENGFLQGSIAEILRTVFTAVVHLHSIVFVMDTPNVNALDSEMPFNVFTRITGEDDSGNVNFFECSRHKYYPVLHVRHARVEDHDDLMPIFNKHSKSLVESFGEYFLSEMIESQDENNKCLVGDVNGVAVGFMSLSTTVDVAALVKCFELGSFNHLNASEDILNQGCNSEEPSVIRKLSDSHLMNLTLSLERSDTDGSLIKEDYVSSSTSSHSDDVVCIRLFCMDDKYEMRSVDLLDEVFRIFPGKDFCVITIPSTCLEFPLLNVFQHIPPRPYSALSQELYVFHRNGLLGDALKVRRCVPDDKSQIEGLVKSIGHKDQILRHLDLYYDAGCSESGIPIEVFVAECLSQVTGMCIITLEDDIDYVRSHYNIEDFIYFSHHEVNEHGRLCHFFLNPLFSHMEKHFLKDVLRLSQKSSLYYRLYSQHSGPEEVQHHSLISCLNSLVPICARRQIIYDEVELDLNAPSRKVLQDKEKYALYHINRKLTLEPKVVNNSRIVLVGASDVAIAFLEQILFCPHLRFNNVTLISPDGLPYSTISNDMASEFFPSSLFYTNGDHKTTSLSTWVTVIKAKVSAINRSEKRLCLSDGKYALYDTLVLCTGRQFNLPVPTESDISKLETTAEALKRKQPQVCTRKVPKNVFIHNLSNGFNGFVDFITNEIINDESASIIIYGMSLHAYTCINGLLHCGVKGSQIRLVQPPNEHPMTCFNDPYVDEHMEKALCKLGVTVHYGYTLAKWNSAVDSDTLVDATFTSDTKPLLLSCKAFVCCHTKTIDFDIFKAINSSYLVFDGRLVIDSGFHSNDDAIRAAGPLTKYSRRYHSDQSCHDYYSSYEIGYKLANKMMHLLDPTYINDNRSISLDSSDRHLLPMFDKPKKTFAKLPGGYHYLHVAKANIPIPLQSSLFQSDYGQVLVTGEKSLNYFRLHLNRYKAVQTITCLAKQTIDVSNLVCLYGLNEKLLNNLIQRFREGLIEDLSSYFREPWCLPLFHDRFADFQSELHEIASSRLPNGDHSLKERVSEMIDEDLRISPEQMNHLIDSYIGLGNKRQLERRLISFLRYNHYHLPMFALPGSV